MMLIRVILVSLRSLLRRPVQTLLILQGVIWGAALGIVPPAILNGTLDQVETQASALGADRLLVTQDLVDVAETFSWNLTTELLDRNTDLLRHATGLTVLSDPNQVDRPTLATDEATLPSRGMTLACGRCFTREEVETAARVCVLEARAAESLYPGRDPIGELLSIGPDLRAEVIGVASPRSKALLATDNMGYRRDHPLRELVEKLSATMGYYENTESRHLLSDEAVLVPHTLFPNLAPRFLEMRAAPKDVLALRARIRRDLARGGFEPVVTTNAVLPFIYGETLGMAMELNKIAFILSIAVGTSVVGVLMVLSVVERQREIAIRRVEGASRWHIGLQFMVETSTLCTVGAVLGIPTGLLLAIVRCEVESLSTVTWGFPLRESIIVVAVVAFVGVLGGMLPAFRAIRVDPVEMLRYE